MCQGLNSHYFHIIGDKLINPIVWVYIPIIRIPIKGGMTIPNIATFDHGTYKWVEFLMDLHCINHINSTHKLWFFLVLPKNYHETGTASRRFFFSQDDVFRLIFQRLISQFSPLKSRLYKMRPKPIIIYHYKWSGLTPINGA